LTSARGGLSADLFASRLRAACREAENIGPAGDEGLPRLIERRSQPRRRRDDDDRVGDLCGRPRRRGSPVRSVKNEAVVGRGQPGENIVERFAADSPPDGMTSRLVERSRRITSTKLALPAKRSARPGISTRSECCGTTMSANQSCEAPRSTRSAATSEERRPAVSSAADSA
jgi:hypothetical protein